MTACGQGWADAVAAYDNTYSRLVAWLKIILPLAALALMSTVFLTARTIDPATDLPFADVDASELAREQRIGQPRFSGVSSDGAAITLSAETIRPDAGGQGMASGSNLVLRIDLPVGTTIQLDANDGALDTQSRRAELGGGVIVTTSDGFRVETSRIAANLEATELVTAGEITATAPMGNLVAGKMRVTRDDADDTYLLVFNEGVKLVYQPQQ
ncbi:hypothetical protein [Aliiroseovarius sp. PTFE2010]|uniref:hypothetical protein n=1 Tax=Aliiroseovarius sp. PTFE2010 TaxID=3417190 RepID=UPI003CF9F04C